MLLWRMQVICSPFQNAQYNLIFLDFLRKIFFTSREIFYNFLSNVSEHGLNSNYIQMGYACAFTDYLAAASPWHNHSLGTPKHFPTSYSNRCNQHQYLVFFVIGELYPRLKNPSGDCVSARLD